MLDRWPPDQRRQFARDVAVNALGSLIAAGLIFLALRFVELWPKHRDLRLGIYWLVICVPLTYVALRVLKSDPDSVKGATAFTWLVILLSAITRQEDVAVFWTLILYPARVFSIVTTRGLTLDRRSRPLRWRRPQAPA